MSGLTKTTLTRRILNVLAVARGQARRRRQSLVSMVEGLEDRRLLSGSSSGGMESIHISPVMKPRSASAAVASSAAPASQLAPLSDTFLLNSRPGATKTIYLDFDGVVTSGTRWNTFFTAGADFTTPAFDLDGDSTTFSPIERIEIQLVWQRVVEDYAPFDVNVTTQDPGVANLINSGGSDTRWGIRVAIGGFDDDWYTGGAGGVAFLNSFGDSVDTPTYVFADTQGDDEIGIAEATSHEVGHTLGLNHDGTASLGYYLGHGTGLTSWAPIMGAGYYSNLTQFSKGEYAGASNKEDDLSIITTRNGFGYRTDDYGNSRLTATQLPSKKLAGVKTINASGVIERNTDQDFFVFSTTGGLVSLNFGVAQRGANLDLSVSLFDSAGTLLMSSLPATSLGASIVANLPQGVYTVMVDGIGFGTLATGFSDYGSLGQYTIAGTIPDTSSGTANGGNSAIEGSVLSKANVPISGAMVFIDLNGDGLFNATIDKSARTDASGKFKFSGLLGGTYFIYQVLPAGWQQSAPASGPVSVAVAIDSTNTSAVFLNIRPPVIGSLGSTITYASKSAATVLAANATVSDADTIKFTGGRLTVGITQNFDANDVLGIRNQGTGAGQIGVFGGVVRYAGVAIGTVSGGISGSNLVITLNSAATVPAVQALLRNITFVSTSGSPSKLLRSIAFSLTDGTGGTSATVTKTVKVT